jgi:hypothetical protein
MQVRVYTWALLVVSLGSSLTVFSASADEATTKAGIRRLLEEGWSISPSARAAADAQYADLQQTAAGDKRLLTASALVLMQQRRYDDAGKRLDELLAEDSKNTLALRAKIWLSATLKNYGGAMVDAERLSALLPAESTQNADAEAEAREHLAFLGRICGYLAGPVADNVDQLARKELEKKITIGLSDARLTVFEQARDGVTQKYFELTDTKEDAAKRVIDQRKAESEQALQDVEATRQQIADRVKELEELASKLQKELNDELNEIQRLDRPLVADLARLDVRAANIRNDLASTELEIDRLSIRLERERDPMIRALIRRDIDQLSFLASRTAGDLATINRQGANVQAQRGALAQRQQQAQNNFGGQLDRANKELIALGKRDKRADYEEKKARRPVTGSSARTAALTTQATALSTYEKFPLDQARQRLLNELR